MLAFVWIAVALVVLYAWIMILVASRYPHGAFDFVVGVAPWQARVLGNATLVVTDRIRRSTSTDPR